MNVLPLIERILARGSLIGVISNFNLSSDEKNAVMSSVTVNVPVMAVLFCNVDVPLTIKLSSTVVVPPVESSVKLPDAVSISPLPLTPIKEPLAKIRSISGNTFTWIEGAVHEGEDTGVIAQEIDALGLPGLTVTRETGYMAVKYDKLTALLIEAVKELSAKVEILEQKLSDK